MNFPGFLPSRLFVSLLIAATLSASIPCIPASAASPKKTQTSKRRNSSSKASNGKTSSGPKTSAEAKRLQEAAQREISQTKEKIRLNDREIKEGLADLNLLSAEIKTGRTKVSDLNKKVSSLQNEITTLNADISKNEAELQRMRDEYLKAVKKMRLNQKNQSMLAFIFSSKDFNQAMRRMRYIRQFSKWKESKSTEIQAINEQLGEEREKLAKARESHAASLAQLTASQKDLEAKQVKQQKLVDGLRQNGAALQNHLSQKQAEANRLRESIANLIAQEQAKAEAERAAREKAEREAREKAAREKAEAERIAKEKAEAEQKMKEATDSDKKKDKKKKEKTSRNKKKDKKKSEESKQTPAKEQPSKPKDSKSSTPAAAGNFAALRGQLPRPVDGEWRITNHFGRHAMPELPDVVYDNPGIDAEVAKGARVKAVAPGKVSGIYKVQGYGTVVIVNHGDHYTVYGNLDSVSVSVGSQVAAGGAIGSAAADPDDPRRGSVHFELWKGREKQNPESWLR